MKHILVCTFAFLSLLVPLKAFSKEFDIDALLKLLKKKESKIRSVEDLLSELPEDYRSKYVIMYASESSQQATAAKPRVIFYGNDARIAIAFNGDPDLIGYNKVEIVATDPQSGISKFYEIAFNDQPKLFKSELPAFTVKENPSHCANCHSSRLHPNWQTYPNWKGAFGSTHDHSIPKHERKMLSDFKKSVKSNPRMERYKSLVSLDKYTIAHAIRDNVNLSNYFTFGNAKRISTEVNDIATKNPQYQAAILSVLNGNDADDTRAGIARFIDYMPEEDKELLRQRYEQILTDTKNRIIKSSHDNVQSIIDGSKFNGKTVLDFRHADLDRKVLEQTAGLRLILEDRLKVDMSDWPLNVQSGTYRFIDGIQGTFDIVRLRYVEFLESQPQWRSFFEKVEKGNIKEVRMKTVLKETFSPGSCATRQMQQLLR